MAQRVNVLLAGLALLLLQTELTAGPRGPASFRFGRLSLEHGLSQSLAMCMIQDSHGFIWIGTEDGLNRYDGYDFTVYRHSDTDSSSLSDSFVYSLYEDAGGTIWVGTWGGGLDRYDPIHDRFLHCRTAKAEDEPRCSMITSMLEDSRKILWVTTWGGGLCRVDRAGNLLERVELPRWVRRAVHVDTLHGIAEDNQGRIWVGGLGTGLLVYSPTTDSVTVYHHDANNPRSLSYDNTQVIYRDRSGSMWVGTWGGGLNRCDRESGEFVRYTHVARDPSSLSSDVVHCVLEDRFGRLWVGTEDGLNLLDPSTGRCVRYAADPGDPYSLSNNVVRSLLEDAGGVVWIGTGDGLSTLTGRFQGFRTLFPYRGLSSPGNVNAFGVCEDSSGRIWIGTYGGGLFRYDPHSEKWTEYPHGKGDRGSPGGGPVVSLCADRRGGVWIGTYGDGVSRYNPGKDAFTHFRHSPYRLNSLVNDYVRCLLVDRQNRLWVGTWGRGLDCYDPDLNRFTHYVHDSGDPHSLSDNEIECLYQDREGTIWIGTGSGGINRLHEQGGAFSHYVRDPATPSTIGSDHIYCIREDGKGMLWIGTAGGGLECFDPRTAGFKHFTESEGLSNNVVYGILGSEEGTLWVSTNKGLSEFDPRSGMFRNFDMSDGLQSQEFNYNAYCRLRSGEMLFGGIKGVNIFDPGDLQSNSHVPPVVLTSFRVFGRSVYLGEQLLSRGTIELPHDRNFFSFEFCALDFVAPANNRYAYMLEGLDREWVKAGSRRYANYTGVEPGTYVFRVKGSNSDGLWNAQGTSVKVVIRPAIWMTWWFKVLLLIVLLAIGILGYRYRVNQLLELERIRLRIANDLHDDVGSNLGSIALTNEMLAKDPSLNDEIRGQLLAVGRSARQTANALRDMVWLIHPEHDKIQDLNVKLRDTAAVMLGKLSYLFDCPEGTLKEIRDIELKRNLFLIFKEVLHNIVRHASASHVDILIRERRKLLELIIRDNGMGFDPSRPANGNGLQSLRRRAGQIGASIEIESKPGAGTTVRLSIGIP